MKAKNFMKMFKGIDPEADVVIQLSGVTSDDNLVYYGDSLPISDIECVGEDETFIIVDASSLKN